MSIFLIFWLAPQRSHIELFVCIAPNNRWCCVYIYTIDANLH